MKSWNLKKLKKNSVRGAIALLGMLVLSQILIKEWNYSLFITVGFIIGTSIWYFYRFLGRLEERTWQEQLNNIVESVKVPVLIADIHHEIIYANHHFHDSVLGGLLSRFKNLPELFSAQNGVLDMVVRCKGIAELQETLDVLSRRMKAHISWEGNLFEWMMVPLFTPTGHRWGTLVECTKKLNETPTPPLTVKNL